MKYETSAKRLSLALERSGMIAQELADRTGIHKSSISQYINGSHAPSNISAGKMAKVLGVSPVWLMGYDVPMFDAVKVSGEMGNAAERESMYMQEMIDIVRNLDEERMKRLVKYAEKLYEIQKEESIFE